MKQSLYNLSFRNGLIIGGISAVLTLLFFFINPLLQYTNFVVPVLSLVIVVALLVILAIDIRKRIGGFWSFGQAFLSLFIMSICLVVIGLVLNFIIIKLNPTLPQRINDAMADTMSQRLEKLGQDQDQIDKTTKMYTDGEFIAKIEPSIVNELIGFGAGLAFYVVISLIIAACVKKTPPLFATEAGNETIE
jgi:hypothetical protein